MRPLSLDETEISITWTWCLKHLLINLVFWLLLFGIVFAVRVLHAGGHLLGNLKQLFGPGDKNASI